MYDADRINSVLGHVSNMTSEFMEQLAEEGDLGSMPRLPVLSMVDSFLDGVSIIMNLLTDDETLAKQKKLYGCDDYSCEKFISRQANEVLGVALKTILGMAFDDDGDYEGSSFIDGDSLSDEDAELLSEATGLSVERIRSSVFSMENPDTGEKVDAERMVSIIREGNGVLIPSVHKVRKTEQNTEKVVRKSEDVDDVMNRLNNVRKEL